MNGKLGEQRYWNCHENGHVKTIPTKPHRTCEFQARVPTRNLDQKRCSIHSSTWPGITVRNTWLGTLTELSWWGSAKKFVDNAWPFILDGRVVHLLLRVTNVLQEKNTKSYWHLWFYCLCKKYWFMVFTLQGGIHGGAGALKEKVWPRFSQSNKYLMRH